VSPPGGETAYDIAARAMPVVQRVRDRHTSGHVMLVSHKATVRVIVCVLLGMPLQRFRTHVACPTTSITSFEFAPDGPLLVGLADVHHLGDLH
jgi:broad specificity phosphatase PhoE